MTAIEKEIRKKEISTLLDKLMNISIPELTRIFEEEAPTISDRIQKGLPITIKNLAYELEGLTISPIGSYDNTFKRIERITGIMLKKEDTSILFELLR
jgi:hypothetical protein